MIAYENSIDQFEVIKLQGDDFRIKRKNLRPT
jgi:hypothetical protein